MRMLFELDTKDYDPNGQAFVRPSVRGIILRDGRIAMVHSLKYGVKFNLQITMEYYLYLNPWKMDSICLR